MNFEVYSKNYKLVKGKVGTLTFEMLSSKDPRYSDSVCYQMFCCKIEFPVIKKLDMDLSTA